MEGRALSFNRLEPDAPAMPFNKFATEIEPEPCSANTMSTRIIRPLEAAEDACLLICRNADACISNAQECRLRLSVFLQGDLNCSTCWTVLDGVAEEVGEHLFHAPWIDIHDEVFRGGEQREALPLSCHLETCQHTPG